MGPGPQATAEPGSAAGDGPGLEALAGGRDAATGQAGVNAAFFGLAALAALNPKLLVVDLILAGNQRPRPMFLCFLLGGIGLGVAVGLDVFVLHADAIKAQGHASAGLDLILGIPLLIVGALLASNHLRRRRGLQDLGVRREGLSCPGLL